MIANESNSAISIALFQDGADVKFYGAFADGKADGNFFVGKALEDEREDFPFAARKLHFMARRDLFLGEAAGDVAGHMFVQRLHGARDGLLKSLLDGLFLA